MFEINIRISMRIFYLIDAVLVRVFGTVNILNVKNTISSALMFSAVNYSIRLSISEKKKHR